MQDILICPSAKFLIVVSFKETGGCVLFKDPKSAWLQFDLLVTSGNVSIVVSAIFWNECATDMLFRSDWN